MSEAEKKSPIPDKAEIIGHPKPGLSWEQTEFIRQLQQNIQKSPNHNAITIDRKMVVEETKEHLKTRIPYKKNEYIWLKKSEITWVNDGKTIFAGLEKEKQYQVLDLENKPVRKVNGQKLYEQSYDEVTRNRQRQEQDNIRKKQKQANYLRNQKALTDSRRALQGTRRR